MADQSRLGFGRPAMRGGRGGFGARGGGPPRGVEKREDWMPVTKLGKLVKAGRITSIEEIFQYSLPIKEHQIIDTLIAPRLKRQKLEGVLKPGGLVEDVLKVKPVQKQTRAGQRTRFKAIVAVGDENGHLGLGSKVAKEVATAIRGAVIAAKLNIVPVRRGYWYNKIGKPHTIPCKVTGKCGSVRVRLIPAPRGTGIVGAPLTKRLLQMAGIEDCYSSAAGQTSTRGNFAKATFSAIQQTYSYLTPDLWSKTDLGPIPYEAFSKVLTADEIDEAMEE